MRHQSYLRLAGPCVFFSLWAFLVAPATSVSASDAILIEFSSAQCGPCVAMQPVVSELIATGTAVRRVDVEAEPNLARRYGIRSTPTYIVSSGGREVTRLLGAQTITQLQTALATNPGGPLIPTRSSVADPGEYAPPQTRLAPLSASEDASQTQAPAMEAMPNQSIATAVELAQAATVRLRVHDGHGFGVGSGTIIDTHGEEALVLTCGHLFRDTEGKGKIEVDVFVGGRPQTVEGVLIDYDAGDRDIALVAIRPGIRVTPVSVVRSGQKPAVGQTAFSFGCDRGDDPSRRDTRITGVNKYNQHLNMSNLEIAGAPIDGRSGGGLFDDRGRLIGVCNAADYKQDLGIYTGPGSIHWQLDRVQLSRLYEATPGEDERDITPSLASVSPTPRPAAVVSQPIPRRESAGEMIVILRSASGSADQIFTLDRPDAELVQRIQTAARH